jgi:hypothetical protein
MRHTYLALGAAAVLAAVAPAPARAQDPRLARLDDATRGRVTGIIDSLRGAGVPSEPLVQKALEGVSKHAPSDRIVTAVQALGRDLGTARAALGPTATDAEVTAGAAAVRGGVSTAALAAVATQRRGGRMLVPLAVLTDLISRGVPADSAAAAVTRVAQRGGGDADFESLDRGIQHDISAGIPPGAAASVRAGGHGPPVSVPGAVNRGIRGKGLGHNPGP